MAAERTASTAIEQRGLPSALSVPLALIAILLLAAFLQLYRLDENGFGTTYYSAGVRSMLKSWHNFFFNSFDPDGFVSLDKPPVALWIQVLSARLFGYSGLSLLAPQAIEGTLSVALTYHLVQRRFGQAAGLLAALFLALTPVAVAIDRSNDTDSCLVLVLLLTAWAASLAAERSKLSLFILAMALAGLGFNVKMLAASVIVPSLVALYWFGAALPWRRRCLHLAAGGLVLAGTSLAWCVDYDLTPADERPFVDSTSENSMIELALGHNGAQRFVRLAGRGRRIVAATRDGAAVAAADPALANQAAAPARGRGGQPRANRIVDTVPVGFFRLADPHLAGQFAWLTPLALFGIAAAAWRSPRRLPLDPMQQALLLWSAWALTYGLVFSFAGGIFHAYYLDAMAPAMAALAAIGLVTLWRLRAAPGLERFLLPAALGATTLWQAYIEFSYLGSALHDPADWRALLYLALLAGGAAATGLLAFRGRDLIWARGALALGLLALLVTPTAWALSPVLGRVNTMLPAASLALLSPDDPANAPAPQRLRTLRDAELGRIEGFLAANHKDEHYLLATQNARQAAPLIIATGGNVMAFGEFMGTDPILTVDRLQDLAASGQLRFVLIGGLDALGRRPARVQQQELSDWIRAHGKPVDPALWRGPDAELQQLQRGRRGETALVELYDLRPDRGPIVVPAADAQPDQASP